MPGVLDCPMCGARVVDGAVIAPGTCPGCGAAFAGGGDDPPQGMGMAMRAWGLPDGEALRVADGLFRLLPDHPINARLAITSDRRDGFYRWWVFLAPGEDAVTVMQQAAAHSRR